MSELKHHPAASTSNISGTTTASAREREEMAMRDEIRQERARARQRDRNLQNAAPEKRSRIERERERNISEKIAIGQPIISSGNSETMYDERLFDNSKGIDAGFNHEEEFNAYDKPWASDKNVGRAIYHPSKNVDEEVYGYDLDKLASGKKFVPDKHFKGADAKTGAVPKDGPVEFQEDPFGLDEFFQEVKQGKKK
ncbi:MAG: SNW domain-containing protein 1 [Marteilia pararefringens]